MIITMVTIVLSDTAPMPGMACRPSMAEVTEIGGVIIPSASRVAPPIIAGITVHLPCRLTWANNENIPPSPLLSAFSVSNTYFTVVCSGENRCERKGQGQGYRTKGQAEGGDRDGGRPDEMGLSVPLSGQVFRRGL